MRLRPFCLCTSIASMMAGFSVVAPSPAAACGRALQIRTQAPGFYRMILGDFEVTALSDGTVSQALDKLLTNIKPGQVEATMARNFETLPVEISINAFLINTRSHLVLVDTGAGELFAPNAGGQLFANLKAAGYRPDQIDAVLLTHMHADHSGGLVVAGRIMFPNAVLHLHQNEIDHWFSAQEEACAPAHQKHSFGQGRASLEPYLKVGKVTTFDRAGPLIPGISIVPAPGHTPGHTFFSIESKGNKLILWGDTVHATAVQFSDPSVTIQYDSDAMAAAAQRQRAFADAARHGYLVAGAHMSFPGIGHVRAEGSSYSWVPVNYSLRLTGQ